MKILTPPPVRTQSETVTIAIEVSDDESVKEVYTYRGEKKVHYLRNKAGGTVFPLTLEIPIDPGSNRLVVVARDQKNIATQKVFYVHRFEEGEEFTEAFLSEPG